MELIMKRIFEGIKFSLRIIFKMLWLLTKMIFGLSVIVAVFSICFGLIGWCYYEKNYKDYVEDIVANMSIEDFELDQKQTIYYDDGSTMLVYAPDINQRIPDEDSIPDVISKVTLAAEDERFYEHQGIDLRSIIRATVANFKSKNNVQGASTITQQLVKLTYLNSEKSYDRKIKEALISLQVEKKFRKNQILMFYLNRGYFGNGIYGIADAAQFYFSKSYKDLDYNEAATLVAILNSPSNLEPINHFEANQERKLRILNIAGISAKTTELNVQSGYGKTFSYGTEGIGCISYVQELIKANGITDAKVETTINKDLQIKIEQMVDGLKEPLQAAAVVIDNETGKVIAIVGGKSTGDIVSLNRAFQSPRQTGSSIKPLLDYGVIFDTYAVDTTFEVVDKGGKGMPKNSSGGHIGRCTIKKAATKSINTVAFRLYSYLVDDGVEPLDYLKQMGFSHITESDYNAKAVSIGGFTYGATVLEMASGYATLANAGLYREPTALKSIDSEPVAVYSPIAAYWTTDLLNEVAKYGTARRLKVKVPISCKTGTTNNNKDAWLCGFTRNYTIAVWCGADNKNEKYSVKSSGEVLDIFQGILDSLELVDEPIYSEDEANFLLSSEEIRRDPERLDEYFCQLSPRPTPVPTPDPSLLPEIPVPTEPIIQIFDEFGNLVP